MRVVTAVIVVFVPCVPGAQGTAGRDARRSTVERIVQTVANIVEQNYVFEDTGRMVAEHLRGRWRDDAYGSVTELAQLADRLTRDLQSVNGDRHLYVTYSRAPGTGPGAGRRVVMRRPGEAIAPEVIEAARRANYDLETVRRMAGNVGYLSLSALSSRGSEEAYAVIDAAMAFLGRTDAMIIDLRRTVGGEPRVSDYLASYFFGSEPVPTLTSYSRRLNRTDDRTTVPVRGTSRPRLPLYLLVGPGTASGTEDFAFIMKQTGRGTLVGGPTAGAGRLTALFPAGDGFAVSVSGGRTYDPRTGKEWERTGIEPDVVADDESALTVAHAAALERMAADASDRDWRSMLQWTRTALLARAKPVAVDSNILRNYAGTYELRLVHYENGKLWYQRDVGRPREELTPVDARTFALGEATRVEFQLQGERVTALVLVDPLGQMSTFPRTR